MNAERVWIGCGAGFAGDRADAAIPVVATLAQQREPKYLIYEVMGERTLAIAQRIKREDPSKGYSPWLDNYLPNVLADCKASGIRIVANFGNANPRAAAKRVHAIARQLDIDELRVAIVEGDDLLENFTAEELIGMETIEGTDTQGRELLAANAYLGATAIVDALKLDADVVLVGRTTDAALVLGPLMYEFDWKDDDYQRLAAGTVAGHLLECGAQVTGGYFADPGYKNVPDLYAVGFPIACIDRAGDIELTKADNTGGVVNRATVIEQLLYEVHDPFNYLTPDVIVNYREISVKETGLNKVRVTGVLGHAPTSTLKATLSVDGGWLAEAEISYAGPNALARATLAAEVVRKRCHILGINEPCRVEVVGSGTVHDDDSSSRFTPGDLPENGEYRTRAAVRSHSKKIAEQVANEVLALFCCGPAAGGGARQVVTPEVSRASILIDRTQVETHVRAIEVGA